MEPHQKSYLDLLSILEKDEYNSNLWLGEIISVLGLQRERELKHNAGDLEYYFKSLFYRTHNIQKASFEFKKALKWYLDNTTISLFEIDSSIKYINYELSFTTFLDASDEHYFRIVKFLDYFAKKITLDKSLVKSEIICNLFSRSVYIVCNKFSNNNLPTYYSKSVEDYTSLAISKKSVIMLSQICYDLLSNSVIFEAYPLFKISLLSNLIQMRYPINIEKFKVLVNDELTLYFLLNEFINVVDKSSFIKYINSIDLEDIEVKVNDYLTIAGYTYIFSDDKGLIFKYFLNGDYSFELSWTQTYLEDKSQVINELIETTDIVRVK